MKLDRMMPSSAKALCLVQEILLGALSLHSSYASTAISSYDVNGTITPDGCHVINGAISNQTASELAASICQYGNFHFEIKESVPNSVCVHQNSTWSDPSTGRTFTFPTSCDIPLFYSADGQGAAPSQQHYPVSYPPLQQMEKLGIALRDVTCPQGLVLMKRANDNYPACVSPDTAQKLVERGWGTIVRPQVSAPSPSSADYRAGQKVGVFTIEKINPGNVTGYYNSPYPIERPGPGIFTTMHVGDTLNPTCDGSAPLVITTINYPYSITVTTGKPGVAKPGGCPICLSADSMIGTPEGSVNVQDIRNGMTVWTTSSDGGIIKEKVIKTSRVFVGKSHQVIDLQMTDGRELWASPNHPTYDGRTVADLKPGEKYDGATVKSSKVVPYKYDYTYDLLPDGPTGNYFANGILVGSTLR